MIHEKLEKMKAQFIAIAMLQRKDLEDTSEMPNYNTSYFMLLKLSQIAIKNELQNNELQDNELQDMEKVLKTLSSTLNEMEGEMAKMIDPQHESAAEEIYAEMQKTLAELFADTAEQKIQNQSSNAVSSHSR